MDLVDEGAVELDISLAFFFYFYSFSGGWGGLGFALGHGILFFGRAGGGLELDLV